MTSVRAATPADAAAIAAVHVRSWQAAYRGIVPGEVLDGLSIAERERRWVELLARGGDDRPRVLVAEREDHLVGFCAATAGANDGHADAEVRAIYVAPAHWRAGVGSALLGAALADLRDAGCDAVRLWVFAANERALAFYRRFGFTPDGAEMVDESSGRAEVRLRARLHG